MGHMRSCLKHTTMKEPMTLTNHVYSPSDEMWPSKNTQTCVIVTSYADEQAKDDKHHGCSRNSTTVEYLTPPPPFTAESKKYREGNLERSENSVGEWQHSAASAGKNKPKTSDRV